MQPSAEARALSGRMLQQFYLKYKYIYSQHLTTYNKSITSLGEQSQTLGRHRPSFSVSGGVTGPRPHALTL